MALTPHELLRKASLTTTDFGGANEAPLSVEQVQQFLRLAITPQDMLPDVRTVMANASKWQESKINFDSRILRPGTEFTRLADAQRIKPGTGVVEISTVLVRGEVPISDEVMEDQVERAGFGDTVMAMIAEASGRDVEELMINGDTDDSEIGHGEGAGSYLRLLDGWLKHAIVGGNVTDAASLGTDYQSIFNRLLVALPNRYKRDKPNMRYYAPTILVEKYRDILAQRGTPLGDLTLEGGRELRYQTILIKPVANMIVKDGTPDTSFILLSHRQNLYAGYRRQIRIETWRDPREGGTSFVLNARIDAQVAHAPALSVAENVNVEP